MIIKKLKINFAASNIVRTFTSVREQYSDLGKIDKMKTLLVLITLVITLASCSTNEKPRVVVKMNKNGENSKPYIINRDHIEGVETVVSWDVNNY